MTLPRDPLTVPRLQAGDLLLRPFGDVDLELIEAASEDSHIPLITTVPSHFTKQEGEAFIHRQWARAERGEGYPFVVADAASGRGVGFIGLWLRDIDQGRASIGYWIIPSERGSGSARTALMTLVAWALQELRIPRLELYVEPWNAASIKTAEAAGFVREGLLRSWQKVGDERRDMYMYALVSADY